MPLTRTSTLCMLFAAGLMVPQTAAASEDDYDCDVAPDKHDNIYVTISGQTKLAGAVKKVEFRPGKFLPVAGARLVNADQSANFGFQLVALSTDAEQYDVVVNINRGDGHRSEVLGFIATSETVPFTISLEDNGQATVAIKDFKYSTLFVPIAEGKAMFFCSTGRFNFSQISASTMSSEPPGDAQAD